MVHMNKVISTTKFVVDNARNVKINKEKIKDFCKYFRESHINHWLNEAPYDLAKLDEKSRLNFLLVFNSISFSYWGNPKWTIEYNSEKFDGAFGMIAALGRAIERKMPILDMDYLSTISEKDFEKILNGNARIPLFKERLGILREIGNIVKTKFNGDFSALIKQANHDAIKLLELIILNFPSFEDVSSYRGNKVYFYKRAQLLVADIHQMFNGKGYGEFKNIDQITACADYKLPKVLRQLGILEYKKELAEKIDKKKEIIKGSEEEVEIRAAVIQANELIKQELKKTMPKIESIHINDHLWLLGQMKSPEDKPYHLTRTTDY